MIPKVIHYCWFGGKPLPLTARKCIASWKKVCPDYEIVRWDESNFDIRQHPFISSAYDAGAWAFVSDWARLKVVLDYGGIYLDTDVKLIKTLDGLLDNQCYIGVQQVGHLCTTGLGFGAVASNQVVRKMLEQYKGIKFSNSNRSDLACPFLNNAVFQEMGFRYSSEIVRLANGTTVYPCQYFDPLAPGTNSKNCLSADTVSIHCYANSWGANMDQKKRKIINIIGLERINWIKDKLRG